MHTKAIKLIGAHAVCAKFHQYFVANTGGGCQAFCIPTGDNGYIYVTDTDGSHLPEPTDLSVIVGRYDNEGNCVGGDQNTPEISVASLETWLDVQLGTYAPNARMPQRYAFIKEGVIRTSDGMLLNTADMSRVELMDVCCWNDPNGCFRDEDRIAELEAPATTEQLRECVESWLGDLS